MNNLIGQQHHKEESHRSCEVVAAECDRGVEGSGGNEFESLLGDVGGVASLALHCAMTSGGNVRPRCHISKSLLILS